MRNRIGLIAAWTFVTLIGISVTSAAVGSVRSNVTDTVAPRFTITDQVATAAAAPATTVAAVDTTAAPDRTPSTVDPAGAEDDLDAPAGDEDTAPTTTAAAPSTTSASSTTAAPSTTAPPASSTTTVAPTTTTAPPSVVKTYSAIGGSVTVEVGGNTVTLLGAVPNAGFNAEEKSTSDTDKVVVEFESEDHTSTIKVEVENGVIEVDIDEEPEGDD